jgi:hypothetical protein
MSYKHFVKVMKEQTGQDITKPRSGVPDANRVMSGHGRGRDRAKRKSRGGGGASYSSAEARRANHAIASHKSSPFGETR